MFKILGEVGANVTLEEDKMGIQDQQGGKSPGEDGLPAKFYAREFRSCPKTTWSI